MIPAPFLCYNLSMKISVIIPCYNVSQYIDRCLNSVASQTIGTEQLEIILVDDGSADDTYLHLSAFEQKYPDNTILIKLDENSGLSAARNIGMEYSSGEYIAFVDSDDVIAESMLEKMVEVITREHADMVECSFKGFSKESECKVTGSGKIRRFDLNDDNVRREYIVDIAVKTAVWGRLYNAELLKRTGLSFIEGYYYEDVFYSGLGMFLMDSVCNIDETLYFYFVNDTGIINSSDNSKLKQETIVIRLMLEDLNRRNLLDDIFDRFYPELEYYCLRKSYMDPVILLFANSRDGNEEDVEYFLNCILELFPNSGHNRYAVERKNDSPIWTSLINMIERGRK